MLYPITTLVHRKMKTGYDLLVWKHGATRACRIGLFSKADLLIFIAQSVWYNSGVSVIEHENTASVLSGR
jgi:hypothetical protein